MSRERRLVVSMIAVVMLGAAPRVSAQAPAGAACEEWSEPRPIRTAAGEVLHVDRPWALELPDGDLLVLAGPTMTLGRERRHDMAGVRVTRGVASPIEHPWDIRKWWLRYLTPRAVRTNDGTVHVFWGTTATDRAGMADTIWHARLEGNRLSEPSVVLSAFEVHWTMEGAADVLATGDDVHVAVTAFDTALARRHEVIVASLMNGRWTARRLSDVGSFPMYARLAAFGDSDRLLAWSADDGNGYPIHIHRSSGASTEWMPFARIDGVRDVDVVTPQLLVLDQRRLFVAWIDQPGRNYAGDRRHRVRAMRSDDAGRSWDTLVVRAPGGRLRNLQASAAVAAAPVLSVETQEKSTWAGVVSGDTIVFREVVEEFRGMSVLRSLPGRPALYWHGPPLVPEDFGVSLSSEWRRCPRPPHRAPAR